jgi:hypothetical protein
MGARVGEAADLLARYLKAQQNKDLRSVRDFARKEWPFGQFG